MPSTIDSFSQIILEKNPSQESLEKWGPGLEVYRRHYLFSLINVLKDTYPTIEKVLGPQNFKFFSREYIYHNPSTNPSIDVYGESFSNFLGETNQLSEISFLSDLAKIDWYWSQAQEERPPLTLSRGILQIWEYFQEDYLTLDFPEDALSFEGEEVIQIFKEDDKLILRVL